MICNTDLSRRSVLSAAVALIAAPAHAEVDAAALYRQAVVLDGNLSFGSFFEGDAVTPEQARSIRASGLTVFKQTLGGTTEGFADAEHELALVKGAITRNPTLFVVVEHAAQIADVKRSGKVGVILSFEAGSMHEGRLTSIDHFAREGVRIMGLSYNLGSPFGAGTLQSADSGLTSLGRDAVTRMNGLGVTVDISHSNDLTGLQATSASRTPVLITHAGCNAVHPHPRNKSDRLLRAVADGGGTVGIFDLSYIGNYPSNPTLDVYMRHLTHALSVCGEDHVGIGSDTDLLSVDTSPASVVDWNKGEADRKAKGVMAPEEGPLPYVVGLNGPDRWQVICDELLRRGYPPRVAKKVLGANFLRVLDDTWTPRA